MLVLDRAQKLDDILPLDAAIVGVRAESTRYQGEWNGNDVYLALDAAQSIVAISIPVDEPGAWSAVTLSTSPIL